VPGRPRTGSELYERGHRGSGDPKVRLLLVSWAKLDDAYPDHPKIVAGGPEVKGLHVDSICYSAAYLTDGLISPEVARRLASNNLVSEDSTPRDLIERTVTVRLWDKAKTGYQVHDYLKYNPTREKVLAERRAKSDGGKAGAEKRWGDRENDSSNGSSDGSTYGATHGSPNGVSDAPVPSTPSPSPDPRPRSHPALTTKPPAGADADGDEDHGVSEEVIAVALAWFGRNHPRQPTRAEVVDTLSRYQGVADREVTPEALLRALQYVTAHRKATRKSAVQVLAYLTANAGQGLSCLMTRCVDDETWDGVMDGEDEPLYAQASA
jgi:hypothetical protein